MRLPSPFGWGWVGYLRQFACNGPLTFQLGVFPTIGSCSCPEGWILRAPSTKERTAHPVTAAAVRVGTPCALCMLAMQPLLDATPGRQPHPHATRMRNGTPHLDILQYQ